MIRIKELTVNFELTVQPKQYNAMKAGGSVTIQYDELVNALVGDLPGFYADLKQDLIASVDRKSTRLNSSHIQKSRMPSSA